MKKKIDLSDYLIKNDPRIYQLCDFLIDEKHFSRKTKFFEMVDVSYNSYKAEKRSKKVSESNSNVKKILDYFKYSYVDYEIKEIEQRLENILHQTYLRSYDETNDNLEFLSTYIMKKDCLQPIYVLFKAIVIAFSDLGYKKSKVELKGELDYLQLFIKKSYFTADLQFILKCLLFYFDKYDDGLEIDKLSIIHNELNWMYYEIRGGKAFIDKDYPIMQMNYEKALALYEKNYNFRRILSISNNFCFYYNSLKQYAISLEHSSKLIFNPYIFELNKLHSFVIMHHFVSLMMLNKYEEIISAYDILLSKNVYVNELSYAIYIISMISTNKLNINDVLPNNNSYIKWLLQYKNTHDKNQLFSNAKREYELLLVETIYSRIK